MAATESLLMWYNEASTLSSFPASVILCIDDMVFLMFIRKSESTWGWWLKCKTRNGNYPYDNKYYHCAGYLLALKANFSVIWMGIKASKYEWLHINVSIDDYLSHIHRKYSNLSSIFVDLFERFDIVCKWPFLTPNPSQICVNIKEFDRDIVKKCLFWYQNQSNLLKTSCISLAYLTYPLRSLVPRI